VNILCTFPGKHGDLLWALPAIRALARRLGEAVDLAIPRTYGSLSALLRPQSYLGQVIELADWIVQDTAPLTPTIPPSLPAFGGGDYDQVFHLGYRDWPKRPLPYETLDCLNARAAEDPWSNVNTLSLRWQRLPDYALDLQTPWITVPPHDNLSNFSYPWCYGFTDEYFELKYGLVELLQMKPAPWPGRVPPLCVGANHRWTTEAGETPMAWLESAAVIQQSQAFLGDCSALHVLAVAIGTPVILMEPQVMRHQGIFYPVGTDGPQVRLVKGIDGQPTWDARHVKDALLQVAGPESMSARYCGCDPGANYRCEAHR
jgi:hypothetical protein